MKSLVLVSLTMLLSVILTQSEVFHMVECIVAKRHMFKNDRVYSQGEKVELSDKDALFLLSQGVVISPTEFSLPTEADGIMAEMKKENERLKEIIKVLTVDNGKLTEELQNVKAQIKEAKVSRK